MSQGLECDCAAIWEVDEDAETLGCTATWVNQDAQAAPVAETMSERSFGRGEGLPGRVWARGESVWFESLDDAGESPRGAAAAGLRSAVALPLRSGGKIIGVVEFFSSVLTIRSDGVLAIGEAADVRLADALERHHAQAALREASRALEHRVRERTGELQHALEELDAAQTETVRRLSQAVEYRDGDTGAHIARMSALAGALARRAGLDAGQWRLIERASPLHDVGKVAIPRQRATQARSSHAGRAPGDRDAR
jgi:GAF domain-containing protein